MLQPHILLPDGSATLTYNGTKRTIQAPFAVTDIRLVPAHTAPDPITVDGPIFAYSLYSGSGYVPAAGLSRIVIFTDQQSSDGLQCRPQTLTPGEYIHVQSSADGQADSAPSPQAQPTPNQQP